MTPALDRPDSAHVRVALLLGVGAGVAAVLVIPYARALTHAPLRTAGLPVPLAVALSGAQAAVLAFGLAWIGLRAGAQLGLGAPLLRAWSERRPYAGPTRWLWAGLVGVLSAAAILLLDVVVFARGLGPQARAALQSHHPQRWQGLLASFYGAIDEEVMLRLFLMTVLAWCIAKLTRSRHVAVFMVANLLAALAFGAGHLPAAAQDFGSLSALVVARTMLLNAIAGFAFGVLYFRFGLEHAMVAHFCADIVLHVIVAG